MTAEKFFYSHTKFVFHVYIPCVSTRAKKYCPPRVKLVNHKKTIMSGCAW